ncbi:MAG TPA: 4'-phosphopantetheinyl transferase superfamily protein [Solirubrobacterales bacterium]|nr:4'-phosphopantetheinyl transferase superfamily protein [Solirubrobacterales bacterium]
MPGPLHPRSAGGALTRDWPSGPSSADLGDEVHVWRADLDAQGWPGPEGLPRAERERAAAIRVEDSRRRWPASRWALRRVLAAYLGVEPAAIELATGEHGKPQLSDASAPRFNLSHSGRLALVAVCRGREVGVDVELIKPRRDLLALAERELEAEAVAAIRAAPPAQRGAAFYRAWTRHEARLKCLGSGLGSPPRAAAVALESLAVGDGYAAALAVAGERLPGRRCFQLTPGG